MAQFAQQMWKRTLIFFFPSLEERNSLNGPELKDLAQEILLFFQHFLFRSAPDRSCGCPGMTIPDVQTPHDLSDILLPSLPVRLDGKGHGEAQIVALHAMVQKAVNLQDGQGFRISQKTQVLDQVGSSRIGSEIDDDHLFLRSDSRKDEES